MLFPESGKQVKFCGQYSENKIVPFYDVFDFDQRLGLGFDFVDHAFT